MFQANILPGQGFIEFVIHEKKGGVSSYGRAKPEGWYQSEKKFFGLLVNASQKEVDQWKQNGHPITHKIIEYGAMQKAKPTDYLVAHDGRKFYVQGNKNHANLNVSVSYYVEERADIK